MSADSLLATLHALHFLRPLWLLTLPLLWALCLWQWRRRTRDDGWQGLVDAELMTALRLDERDGAAARSPWPWLALAWTLAVLALAGPTWERAHAPGFRAPAAWVVVLDLSPSMNAADVSPDRVSRARFALDDILGAARDTRVGLVVFSDESYTVTPLTDDVATVRALLTPLKPAIMPTAGDRIAPALERAGQMLATSGARERRVIVLSDGFADPAAAFAAAAKLKSQGATVDVIGVGTRQGAPVSADNGRFQTDASGAAKLAKLDRDGLQQLAASAGGRYADLANAPALIAHLQDRTGPMTRGRAGDDVHVDQWRDGGVWLLPVLLLLVAPLARRGWL